jgi:hypothetical protein
VITSMIRGQWYLSSKASTLKINDDGSQSSGERRSNSRRECVCVGNGPFDRVHVVLLLSGQVVHEAIEQEAHDLSRLTDPDRR